MSMRKAGFYPVLFLGLFMLALGLYVHIRFSLEAGQITYFKAAYDEDFYYLNAQMGKAPVFYRLLSDLGIGALIKIGFGHGLALVVFDAIFPAMAAIAAYLLTGLVAKGIVLRILLSLVFVFSQDLLSMGNSSIWVGGSPLVFLRGLSPLISELVPDYTTSYLGILRSPEPQLSQAFLFFHWYLVLRVLNLVEQRQALPAKLILSLLAVNTVLSFSYVFVSFALFFLMLGLTPFVAYNSRSKKFTFAWSIAFVLPALFVVTYFQVKIGTPNASSSVFNSRMPIFTPGAVLSLLLSLCWLARMRAQRLKLDEVYAAMAGILPIALLNQQIITGLMVNPGEWERYINYPLLVFSAIWFMRAEISKLESVYSRKVKQTVTVALIVLLGILLLSLHVTYKNWLRANRESLEITKLLQSLPESYRSLPIVLEDIGLAPLVKIRLDRGEFIGSYINLFWNPVRDLREQGLEKHLSVLQQKNEIYEYLFRTNVSPERFKQLLMAEVNARSGHFLAFFFSFMDHWYPMSANRRVRDMDIRNAIPIIVAEYAELLRKIPKDWRREVLLVSNARILNSKACKSDFIAAEPPGKSQVFVQLQHCE